VFWPCANCELTADIASRSTSIRIMSRLIFVVSKRQHDFSLTELRQVKEKFSGIGRSKEPCYLRVGCPEHEIEATFDRLNILLKGLQSRQVLAPGVSSEERDFGVFTNFCKPPNYRSQLV